MSARAELSEHVSDLANYRLPPSIQRELDTHIDAYRAEVVAEVTQRLHEAGYLGPAQYIRDNPRIFGEESSPAGADAEAYDGELAMHRGLVRALRPAAREGDLAAIQSMLYHHASDDAAARTRSQNTATAAARQAALLTTIVDQPGRWKSGDAVRTYRALGIHPISPGTAASDLKQLAEAGHLIRHDEPGVTWYTLNTRKDVRP